MPIARRKCDVYGCDDDLDCCIERRQTISSVVDGMCTSMSSLANDIQSGKDVHNSVMKNDRYVYLVMVIVMALCAVLFFVRLSRPHPPPFYTDAFLREKYAA